MDHNVAVNRFIWSVAITGAGALVGALVMALAARPVPGSAVVYLLTVPIPFLAAGTFLLWRHPTHRAVWWLVCGTSGATAYAALLERIIRSRIAETGQESWMSWALFAEALVMMLGLACLSLLIGLFPRGVPATRGEHLFSRLMWMLPLPMLIALVANENILVEPMGYGDLPPLHNPLHVTALGWLGPATSGMRSLLGSALLAGLVLLLIRYRRVASAERRQIRWVAFASVAALGLGVVPFIISPLLDPDTFGHGQLLLTVGMVALVLIPISVVLAIEQPRWLDPDRFISRSFTYGALSIGIFLIYGAIAAGLGLAAGARFPIEIAIVVTAVLAFAFQPARARLQTIADRLVFGDRLSPLEAVAGFDRSIRRLESATGLSEHLAEMARRALRLRWATVTIPPETPVTSGDGTGGAVHEAPIEHSGEVFGSIRCGPKISGQFKEVDSDLVAALAGQAALVVSNARLAARIVHAQEAERRRLERNLHDGAQQELVALVAKLGLARARVKKGEIDETTLIDLQRDAGNILKDLRDLAQGIHPSVLTDGGLVEAVEDRCSRLPLNVVVEASADLRTCRFGDDVEGAAYFFVTEGLTNVLKHARATEARIRMIRMDNQLELTVADNGTGFEPNAASWTGLAGLTDRFAALSGDVSVNAAAGSGTVLAGRIPIVSRA
jgi:signal transduction histidine kinase